MISDFKVRDSVSGGELRWWYERAELDNPGPWWGEWLLVAALVATIVFLLCGYD